MKTRKNAILRPDALPLKTNKEARMDDSSQQHIHYLKTLESEFQREEAELRSWLDTNVTDLASRKWYLERQREDHIARGRRYI